MRESTASDGGMTFQQRADELTAQARRLVDSNIVRAANVVIDRGHGIVWDASDGQLLHYESGIIATAFHLRPQPWGVA